MSRQMSKSVMVKKFSRNKDELEKIRVVAHLDIDCFSCQVTLRHMPDLKGKPFATFLRMR